jgi:tetratricopeptide (TPR) repeat protein
LSNISQIHQVKGDYDTALRYLEQSLAIRQQIGDINGMAVTLTNMGAMLFEQDRYEEATPLLLQAQAIFQKLGSPNVQIAASYLQAIIERIGEARFKEMVARLS